MPVRPPSRASPLPQVTAFSQRNAVECGSGLFNHQYFTRSFDDNNKGKYVGEPRTVYVQTSVAF
jgi:outer membrane receptor for Fe3+-dicitrate